MFRAKNRLGRGAGFLVFQYMPEDDFLSVGLLICLCVSLSVCFSDFKLFKHCCLSSGDDGLESIQSRSLDTERERESVIHCR